MKPVCLSCVDSVRDAIKTNRHRQGTCARCGKQMTSNWILGEIDLNNLCADDYEEINSGFLNLGLEPYKTQQDPSNKRKRLFLAFYPHRPEGQQEVLYCLSLGNYVVSIETAPVGRAGSYEGYASTDEHAIYCVRELIVASLCGRILEEIEVEA